MIRQSLHSPSQWGPQFLDPDIFRTESPSSTVRHKSPSQQIFKIKHVLESQGDVLEKSQGRHITKRKFSLKDEFYRYNLPLQICDRADWKKRDSGLLVARWTTAGNGAEFFRVKNFRRTPHQRDLYCRGSRA